MCVRLTFSVTTNQMMNLSSPYHKTQRRAASLQERPRCLLPPSTRLLSLLSFKDFSLVRSLALGTIIEWPTLHTFFIGIYTLVFIKYVRLQLRTGRFSTSKPLSVATVLLYLLCAATLCLDVASTYLSIVGSF